MITHIRGVIVSKLPNLVVVECGGLGYEIGVPLTVSEKLPAVGESVMLLTEFVVREESQALYGFIAAEERALFRRLIKVSGIGAKIALAMMSAMTADELLAAIGTEETARLVAIPGIGAKTAERLIVDMRGSELLLKSKIAPSADSEVEQALAALGYNKAEIRKALRELPRTADDTTESLVRAALRLLSAR